VVGRSCRSRPIPRHRHDRVIRTTDNVGTKRHGIGITADGKKVVVT
jgi:hypothetical protein